MKRLLLSFAILCLAAASYAVGPVTGPSSVCQGSTITLSDTTTGGAWSSSNAAIAAVGSTGIVSGVASGTATISYTAGGSSSTLTITVNPIPTLSSSLTPPAICDSQVFNYIPMSSTAGTTFTWSRAAVPGIAGPASAGTGTANEALLDTTPLPVAVVYTYTLTASGCSHVQTVTVTVNPTPMLTSALSFSPMCDTQAFIYVPISSTPGATFAWNRPGTSGVLPATSFGFGSIHELLTDTRGIPDTIHYYFRLGINGCANPFAETVTVIIDTDCSNAGITNITGLSGIQIYPNPSVGFITVSGFNKGSNIELYNALGICILRQKECIQKELKIDIAPFPAGMYYIVVRNDQETFTSKITKQ